MGQTICPALTKVRFVHFCPQKKKKRREQAPDYESPLFIEQLLAEATLWHSSTILLPLDYPAIWLLLQLTSEKSGPAEEMWTGLLVNIHVKTGKSPLLLSPNLLHSSQYSPFTPCPRCYSSTHTPKAALPAPPANTMLTQPLKHLGHISSSTGVINGAQGQKITSLVILSQELLPLPLFSWRTLLNTCRKLPVSPGSGSPLLYMKAEQE